MLNIAIIREKQIKTTMRYHQSKWPSSKSLQIINAGEGIEKRESSYTVGGIVNWYSHYGEQNGDSFKKTKNRASIWTNNTTHRHTYPEKNMVLKDICTLMFIATLVTIVKRWKQPKYTSTEEWIRKMWYIYIMEYSMCVCMLSHYVQLFVTSYMYMCIYMCVCVCVCV